MQIITDIPSIVNIVYPIGEFGLRNLIQNDTIFSIVSYLFFLPGSDSLPEQSRRVSTEFEINSNWKATYVDLCQKCQVFLKGKQPMTSLSK